MTRPTDDETTAQLEAAAQAWRAEEHHDAARVERKVEAMNEAEAGPRVVRGEAVEAPAGGGDAGPALDLGEADVAGLVLTVADVVAARVGPAAVAGTTPEQWALTDAERARLTPPLVAVMRKWFPEGLALSPEWVLLGTAAAIYGAKAMAPAPAAPAAGAAS